MLLKLVVLVAGFTVLSVVFGILEKAWPSLKGQRRLRRGVKTDIAWYFWDTLLNRSIVFVAVVAVAIPVAMVLAAANDTTVREVLQHRHTFVSDQPAWVQAIELFFLFDLIGYWTHRGFHHLGLLWKYHAVHHSSTELDWLSAVRVHPVNEIGTRVIQALPLLLFGFNATLLGAYVPLLTFYAIGLHANVPWDFGPLRYVIASPVFHRWHHTSEREGLDRNFAGAFPWLDALFGTLYMPRGRQPVEFGVLGEQVPEGLWRQLLYPWRGA